MLSDSFSGNYTIRCGQCAHLHYRVIEKGIVTSDRHNKNLGVAEVIHVMPSATSKEKRQMGTIARLRNMAAAGLLE